MTMESITAWCWGPLSLLLAIFIVRDHPLRHPLQIIISLGQLYGNVLYYGTCAFDFWVYGVEYSRPEGGYFWGYFIMLNAFWVGGPVCKLVFLFVVVMGWWVRKRTGLMGIQGLLLIA